MSNNWIILLSTCALLSFTGSALAEETATPAQGAAEVKTEKKSARKKRQLMCKDCGKPEKNCECKGEGHDKAEHKAEDKK